MQPKKSMRKRKRVSGDAVGFRAMASFPELHRPHPMVVLRSNQQAANTQTPINPKP